MAVADNKTPEEQIRFLEEHYNPKDPDPNNPGKYIVYQRDHKTQKIINQDPALDANGNKLTLGQRIKRALDNIRDSNWEPTDTDIAGMVVVQDRANFSAEAFDKLPQQEQAAFMKKMSDDWLNANIAGSNAIYTYKTQHGISTQNGELMPEYVNRDGTIDNAKYGQGASVMNQIKEIANGYMQKDGLHIKLKTREELEDIKHLGKAAPSLRMPGSQQKPPQSVAAAPEAKPHATETEQPAPEIKQPAVEAKPPVAEAEQPAPEKKQPVAAAKQPAAQTKQTAPETGGFFGQLIAMLSSLLGIGNPAAAPVQEPQPEKGPMPRVVGKASDVPAKEQGQSQEPPMAQPKEFGGFIMGGRQTSAGVRQNSATKAEQGLNAIKTTLVEYNETGLAKGMVAQENNRLIGELDKAMSDPKKLERLNQVLETSTIKGSDGKNHTLADTLENGSEKDRFKATYTLMYKATNSQVPNAAIEKAAEHQWKENQKIIANAGKGALTQDQMEAVKNAFGVQPQGVQVAQQSAPAATGVKAGGGLQV